MPYLNLDPDFPEHPKSKRLQARCGKNSHLLLINLWCFAGKYHPKDGDLSSYSPEEIESFAGWDATSNAKDTPKHCFYNACIEIGFIDKNKRLHDWKKHEGHLLAFKLRAKDAADKRWEKIRGKSKKPKQLKGDATSIPQAMLKPCSSNAPNLTLPNQHDKDKDPKISTPCVGPKEIQNQEIERIIFLFEKKFPNAPDKITPGHIQVLVHGGGRAKLCGFLHSYDALAEAIDYIDAETTINPIEYLFGLAKQGESAHKFLRQAEDRTEKAKLPF